MPKSKTNANPVHPSDFQAIHLVLSEWEDGERSRFLELIEDLEPEVPGLGGLMAKAVSERVFESLAIAASIYTKHVPDADVRHVLYVLCAHFSIEPKFELNKSKSK
jgi:hypothetical protein